MIIQPSYLHNGISHIGKMASFILNHGPGHYDIGCGIKGQFAFHEEEFHPPAPPQFGEKKKNWWMTPKNNRAPLLCIFKLFASFRSHWWIQTGVTVRKRLILLKIDNFLSRVTLKFDGWPSKTIGHLFYATSSYVQHFVATDEFKLELQSGNT